MSDKKLSRRDMLKLAGSATLATAFPSPRLTAHAESPQIKAEEAAEVKTEATAEEVVNALEGAYGVHPGRRRNHTKGIGAEGFFVRREDTCSRALLHSRRQPERAGRRQGASRRRPRVPAA